MRSNLRMRSYLPGEREIRLEMRVPSVGRSACKCSPRRRPLPRRSARARAAGVVRGAPLKAVVPAWRRRDRVELSQCGAGGLLKARATMRVSHLRGPRRSVRSTVLAVAVAVGALVTLVSLPLPGRGIEYGPGGRRIYPRYTIRLHVRYTTMSAGVRFSAPNACGSLRTPRAPPREARFIVLLRCRDALFRPERPRPS